MKKDREKRKQRIKDLKRGRVQPRNAEERALCWDANQRKIANRIKSQHANAAINKHSPLVGKIIVVAPKAERLTSPEPDALRNYASERDTQHSQ